MAKKIPDILIVEEQKKTIKSIQSKVHYPSKKQNDDCAAFKHRTKASGDDSFGMDKC